MGKNILLILTCFSVLLCDWEIVSFPDSFVNGLTFNDDNIFVVIATGEIFHSTDEGDSWSLISQIPNILGQKYLWFQKFARRRRKIYDI